MDLRKRMLTALNEKYDTSYGSSKFYTSEVWNEITGDYDHEDHDSLEAARKHVFRVLESWQREAKEEDADYDGNIDAHRYVIRVVYE